MGTKVVDRKISGKKISVALCVAAALRVRRATNTEKPANAMPQRKA